MQKNDTDKLKIRVVGCFIECKGKILVLHRPTEKSQGGKWGLPAGKVEVGESDTQAVLREIKEETGVNLNQQNVEFLFERLWKFDNKDVEFVLFKTEFDSKPEIHLDLKEHDDYMWATYEEISKRNDLIHGFDDLLMMIGYK